MMSRFDIQAALVSVPQLARLLGRSKSTIYASVKEGRFFIPHRMVGESPMFTIDDVVDWYQGGTVAKEAAAIAAPARVVGEQRREVAESDARGDEPSREKQRRNAAVDGLVARALNALGSRAG
jgi:predicted DNA-binding transcriptional regulator AlpA